MTSRRTRLLLPVLVSSAGLAVAGCGGGGGDGDEASYVKTYEGACKSIVASASGSQTQIAALGSGSKVSDATVAKVRTAIESILDAYSTQVGVLADADAPGRWSDFQDSVSEGAKDSKEALATAKSQLAGIRTESDLPRVRQVLQSLKLKSDDLPDDLAKKVPTCTSLLASAT